MARWFLNPPLPGESLADTLKRLIHDQNLILGEQEQLAFQTQGKGGYKAQFDNDIDMQDHRVTKLSAVPLADTDAVPLAYLKAGRVLYTEGERFDTAKRVAHPPAVNQDESVTLAQLRQLYALLLALIERMQQSARPVPFLDGALDDREPDAAPIFFDQNSNPRVVVTPAIPASATAISNTTGVHVTVYIVGGTLTAITVGGTATGITAAAPANTAHVIPLTSNQTIALTYTGAPTWVW